jgi:hypothetical protein
MEEKMCEVIGCGAPAHWFVSSEQDGQAHEQYLCHPHWRHLLASRTHHIHRWAPVNPHDHHPMEERVPGTTSSEPVATI